MKTKADRGETMTVYSYCNEQLHELVSMEGNLLTITKHLYSRLHPVSDYTLVTVKPHILYACTRIDYVYELLL